MNIYDCILFNGELELLELRFNILNDLDCYFVIMEAGENFRNKPKPFYYEENKKLYEKWENRIIYLKIPHLGFSPPLKNEWFSRNVFWEVAKDAKETDYFILSDVDEIPCPIATKKYIDKNLNEPFCFFNSNFLYKINLINPIVPHSHGSVVFEKKFLVNYNKVKTRDDLSKITVGFQRLRELRSHFLHIMNGWHYCCCFSELDIMRKFSDYGHPEMDVPENIKNCIENKISIYAKKEKLKRVILTDQNCSEYVMYNLQKYSHLIDQNE